MNAPYSKKDNYIFHIPHAHIEIPDTTGYNLDLVDQEILKLTDWATDLIFNVDGIDKIATPFSRVYCDVERFSQDADEPMFACGRGMYYTKNDNGEEMRKVDIEHKNFVYENHYKIHHAQLSKAVNQKLKDFNHVTIVDCHSFPDQPFKTDLIKDSSRPDICIGTDLNHTPSNLLLMFKQHFINKGFSVAVNSPYSGSIVPMEHFNKNLKVKTIMIELNRKLYMDDEHTINLKKVIQLQKIIKTLFDF
jgi:N-formylglutamate deformylase